MEENHFKSSENGASNPAWVAEEYLAIELLCEYKFTRQGRKGGMFQVEEQSVQRRDVTGQSKNCGVASAEAKVQGEKPKSLREPGNADNV